MPSPAFDVAVFYDPFVLAHSYVPASTTKTLVSTSDKRKELYFGGVGRIQGTVKIDDSPDIPVRRKVRLVREKDAVCIRETWSDAATGAYEFTDIDMAERYTVISYDYENNYRAVIADNLQPELMT